MIWVGTSGYNYPEWKGSFYPDTLPASKMLPYYAERFPTVEINYTFYRAPTEKILQGWDKATPDRFKLTLKAPRRITHDARLRDCAESVRRFSRNGLDPGAEAGRPVVSTAAVPEEGRRAARHLSRRILAGRLRRVRIQACVVAGRGDLFPAAGPAISPSVWPTVKSCRCPSRSPRTTDTSGCGTKGIRQVISSGGPR